LGELTGDKRKKILRRKGKKTHGKTSFTAMHQVIIIIVIFIVVDKSDELKAESCDCGSNY